MYTHKGLKTEKKRWI